MEREKPIAPKEPRILLGDETTENLQYSLAKKWPSSAIASSEAGLILGSYGMKSENVMNNLSFYDVLWDGGAHSIGRKGGESFTIDNARLTVSLMIQPAAFEEFFEKNGALARGIGFFARFLTCKPQSTQGTRLYKSSGKRFVALERFQGKLKAILDVPLPFDEEDGGVLRPLPMKLSNGAFAFWQQYHDEVEVELREGGLYSDAKDIASKSADNAARIAALFQLFDTGARKREDGEDPYIFYNGEVSAANMKRGANIARWYLGESKLYFGSMKRSQEKRDAAYLERWLLSHPEERDVDGWFIRREVQRIMFNQSLERLVNAIDTLVQLGRLRTKKQGRRILLQLHPQVG